MAEKDRRIRSPAFEYHHEATDAANSVLRAAQAQGHPVPQRLKKTAKLLGGYDVTKLPSEALGRKYSRIVGVAAYARVDLAQTEVRLSSLKRSLLLLEAQLGTDDTKQRWRMKEKLRLDPRVDALEVEIAKVSGYAGLLRALIEGYDARAVVLSREITRRQTEMDQSGRA